MDTILKLRAESAIDELDRSVEHLSISEIKDIMNEARSVIRDLTEHYENMYLQHENAMNVLSNIDFQLGEFWEDTERNAAQKEDSETFSEPSPVYVGWNEYETKQSYPEKSIYQVSFLFNRAKDGELINTYFVDVEAANEEDAYTKAVTKMSNDPFINAYNWQVGDIRKK